MQYRSTDWRVARRVRYNFVSMIASQKKCNLCGKTGFRIVCHHPQGSLGQCVNCGLIFSPQQLPDKEHLKQYGASYYQQKDEDSPGLDYFAYEQCWLEGSRKKLAAIGEAIGGGRLLDVGCGVGFFLKVAREEGWDVMGVEVSKWAAEKAREMYDLDVINSTFEAAHFEDGSFDVVTLWHVLEHCPSPTKTLEHCHEILRPGGLIALEVPNVESRAARRSLLRWEHTAPQEHLFYFGPRTLQKILVKTGFMNV
ncbi:MAG: class I SAM-dependent methyltransferase, partial [Planctomycetes bacterium]|nr:class I SAM-dependent methyltransferase [Planctomycetota bacterium]